MTVEIKFTRPASTGHAIEQALDMLTEADRIMREWVDRDEVEYARHLRETATALLQLARLIHAQQTVIPAMRVGRMS